MVYEDSTLVINQLNKDWSYSSEKIDAYCAKIRKLKGKFYGIEYHHVVRDQNQLADLLSKSGPSCTAIPPGSSFKIFWRHPLRKIRKFKKSPH